MAVKEKQSCCAGNKCTCIIFVLVVAAIVGVACVTFLVDGVRAPYPREELKWWQTTIIYQVYPRSFQDSNGDGTGDLNGIISRLDYFNNINVSSIWLSPFYESPMRDFGYDVRNYTTVDPLFGSMGDFDKLIKEAHKRNIKVIVDFVPNHTSNESDWFVKSRHAVEGDPYRDYYIWDDGKNVNGKTQPPNNWQSMFEGSAWEWDTERQQYYYHAFLGSQPDLNLRNENVLVELDNALRFWLNKGVDGFRVDAIPHMFEVEDLTKDEPAGQTNGFDPNVHKYTKNQPEVFDIVKRWMAILEEYKDKDDQDRFLLAETVGISKETRARYYDAGSVPFYFNLIAAKKLCNATADCFKQLIEEGLDIGEGQWPNFVIGNHGNPRIADRMGKEYVDAMNILLLSLPGTPTTYYGEELGMNGGNYSTMPPQDPYAITSNDPTKSRDSERNPMQWDTSANAGFSNCSLTSSAKYCTWLMITPNTNSRQVNVETERINGASSLSIYRYMAQVRTYPAFQSLNIELKTVNELLIYSRWSDKDEYVVAVNLGSSPDRFGISDKRGYVEVATDYNKMGTTISLNSIKLEKGEAMVIKML